MLTVKEASTDQITYEEMTFISSSNILQLRVNYVVHEPNELPLNHRCASDLQSNLFTKLQYQKKSFHRKVDTHVCNKGKVIFEYLM